MKTKLPHLLLAGLSCLAAFTASTQAAMILEYKFEGDGTNTGTTGATNNLSITSGTADPTFTGPASPAPGSTSSLDNSALTYNTAGGTIASGSISNTALPTDTDLTMTGWINNQSGASLTGNPRIFDKASSTAGFTLQFANSTSLSLIIVNAAGTQGIATSSSYNYGAQNTWTWFGVTYTASTGSVSFYSLQSGIVTLVSSSSLTNSVTGYVNNSNSMRVLNTGSSSRAYDGYADDLRLFNDVESISAMQALTAIPEPATIGSFMALGAMSCAVMLRRKRRNVVA
ncbi:MAG: PEP-CTERM sorting domain-containing protein [Opitutaceae bacterium]|jgi:hypothetical protein